MKSTFALALLAILLSASSASRAHDAFRYGSSSVMTPKDKYMASNLPLVKEDSNTTVVDLDFDLTATEWGMFSAGLLVGLSTEYSQNLTNDCLADTATLIVAAVHINEYMGAYIESNQTDNLMLAYGLTYTVDGMATLSELDCSDIEHDINEWLTNLTSSFSPDQGEYEEDFVADDEEDSDVEVESKSPRHIVKSHEDFSMPEEYDTEDDEDDDSENAVTQTYKIFETINSVLNDIETILAIVEVGINSSQIVEHWEEEAYYDAGYSVGTSGLGIVILMEEIVAKYKELSEEYDDATDLEEDEDDEDTD